MFKFKGEKFSSVFGTSKDKRNQETPLHTWNLAPRKLSKYYLTAYYGIYCQEKIPCLLQVMVAVQNRKKYVTQLSPPILLHLAPP